MSVDSILRLAPEDDLASLREKLKRTQAQAVIVIAPDDAPALHNVADVKLLRRYADQMQTRVVIVTRDPVTRDLARREGFSVYAGLGSVPRRWRGGLSKQELAGVPSLPHVPFYRYLVKLGCLGLALIVVAAGLAVLAGVAIFLAPAATITLMPATEPLSTTVDLLASAQIRVVDVAKGQFPARPVQVLIEDTGQLETTGRKRAPDAPATGTVVFANRSANALTVAKGTIVRTATGVSFRFSTEEDANVPSGAFATVRVPIKAVDAGPNGNVKAGTISIVEGTMSFQVSVLNDQDTSGGTEKQVRFVTLEDRNNLRDAIVQKLHAKSLTELRKAIQPDDVLPAETLSLAINETIFDKPQEAIGEYLSGKVRATVSGLMLEGDNLRTVVAAHLGDQIRGGFVVLPQAVTYGAPANVKFSDGVISLQITATARSQAQINKQDVKRAAAGKTRIDAEQAIARNFLLAQPPQIDLERGWLGRMPMLTSRIAVIIE